MLPGHCSWEKTDILKLVCAVLSNGPVNHCPLGALSRHHSGLPARFSPGLSLLSFHSLWLKAEVLSFQQLFLHLTPVWHMIKMVFVLLEHKTMTCRRWGPILYCMEVWTHLVPKHINVKTHRGWHWTVCAQYWGTPCASYVFGPNHLVWSPCLSINSPMPHS